MVLARSRERLCRAPFVRVPAAVIASSSHSHTDMQPFFARLLAFPVIRLAALLSLAGLAAPVSAVPANPYDYTRTTSFTYNPDGTLATKTVEPNDASVCSTTTLSYDPQGNPAGMTVGPCAISSGAQLFLPRTATITRTAAPAQILIIDPDASMTQVSASVAAGTFISATQDPISTHPQEALEFDPRFGVQIKHTDMNRLVAIVLLDAFGRVIRETYPDHTSRVTFYCLNPSLIVDASSFSKGCPVPTFAEYSGTTGATYTHTELRDTADQKIGAFVRTYFDRLGRVARVATESFDGPNQPAAYRGAVVIKDVMFNNFGAQVAETRPYFLSSLSPSTTGSSDYGWTTAIFDDMDRVSEVHVTNPNATGPAELMPGYNTSTAQPTAKTTYKYVGQTTTTTNDAQQKRVEEHTAEGRVFRVTDDSGAQAAFLDDAFGNVMQTRDALGNVTSYSYDTTGHRLAEFDLDKGTTQGCYDALGQLKATQNATMRGSQVQSQCPPDVETGTTVAHADPAWTKFAYDLLGQPTQRSEPEMSSTWQYDTLIVGNAACGTGTTFGLLCESTTTTGIDRKTMRDVLNRTVARRVDAGTGKPSFGWGWSYGATNGRLAQTTYPTGLQVSYGYTTLGYASALNLTTPASIAPLPDAQGVTAAPGTIAGGTALWQAYVANALGATEQELFQNNVTERSRFEASTGHVVARSANLPTKNITDQQYSWDTIGNLKLRIDAHGDGNGAVIENFGFDNINRLTSYSLSGPNLLPGMTRDVALQYNALGQLLYKSDEGNYVYGASGGPNPHVLTNLIGAATTKYGWDLSGNVKSADGGKYRNLRYTSFDRVSYTDNGATGAAAITYNWLYDERHARINETRTFNGNSRSTWYSHPDDEGGLGFELETDSSPASQSNRHFLSIGGDVVGVLVSSDALPTLGSATSPPALANVTLRKVEYWHKDHLGSLIATTDHTGAATQNYSYDPFGKRRYTSGTYDEAGKLAVDWNPALNSGTARGFTLHEGLDDIGLVNMNGRIFDPTLGLFIQADKWVPHELSLQSFGRYTYAENNPLNVTDPSGFDTPQADEAWRLMEEALKRGSDLSKRGVQNAINTAKNGPASTSKGDPATQNQGSQPATQIECETGCQAGSTAPRVMSAHRDAVKGAKFAEDHFGDVVFAAVPGGLEAKEAKVGLEAAGAGAQRVVIKGESGLRSAAKGFMEFIERHSPSWFKRGCSCFVAGTPVLTDSGYKAIEKIAVGDLVQSRDPETGETALKPVADLILTEGKLLYRLTLRDSHGAVSHLDVTDNHPFRVKGRGWIDSAKLRVGMEVEAFDRSSMLRVLALKSLGRTEPTYNLTIEGFHTYFVGSLRAFVHNAGPCPTRLAGVPGRVQSRINLATGNSKAGMRHIAIEHFSGKPGKSQFSVSEEELRSLLGRQDVIDSPIVDILNQDEGIRFVRVVDVGQTIGTDKYSKSATSIMTVMSDRLGNIVTAFPGRLPAGKAP